MAVRLDPFRRIVNVGWPTGPTVRTYLERVFFSDWQQLTGGYSAYSTQLHFFHYRRTPSSPLLIIERLGYVFDAVGSGASEKIIGAEFFRCTVGHTAALFSDRTFVEIPGAEFFLPPGEDPRAWPLPEDDPAWLPTIGIEATNFYQWRLCYVTPVPPGGWGVAPIAWSAWTRADGVGLSTFGGETKFPAQDAILRLTVGSTNVAPGRDRTGFTVLTGGLAL